MVRHCNTFLIAQLEVSLPQGSDDRHATRSFKMFVKWFTEYLRLKGIGCHYVWARRVVEGSANSPYVLALFLDGERDQCFVLHMAKANELWAQALRKIWLEGLVYLCDINDPLCPGRRVPIVSRRQPGYCVVCTHCFEHLALMARVDTRVDGAPVVGDMGWSEL
jgi:hypothetical protein